MAKGDGEKSPFEEALKGAQDEWSKTYKVNLDTAVDKVYKQLLPSLKAKLIELGTVLNGEDYEDAVNKILGEIDPRRKKAAKDDKGKGKQRTQHQ